MNLKKLTDEQLKAEYKSLESLLVPTEDESTLGKIQKEIERRGYAIGYNIYFTKEL